MRSRSAEIHLPTDRVRTLGYGFLALGLLLPFAMLYVRAAAWNPPPAEVAAAEELRPEMIVLEPGIFTMGITAEQVAELPERYLVHFGGVSARQVELTSRFALSRTEITQGQYFEVMGERPMETEVDFRGDPCRIAGLGDRFPVACVTWLDAVQFCNALSKIEGLEPAYEIVRGTAVRVNVTADGYRLPTEAEWEYAARAGGGISSVYVGTNDPKEVCKFDNVADRSALQDQPDWSQAFDCDDGFARLAPVRSGLPNAWHFFDLGGNVTEWVWDGYELIASYEVVIDPIGPEGAVDRVLRGASWTDDPFSARIPRRDEVTLSAQHLGVGFRIARTIEEPESP